MLQEVNRKLHHLRQAVLLHQKHIEKFDALSLSSLEYDERTMRFIFPPSPIPGAETVTSSPELKGLHRLVKEVNDILNEGHIAQQSLVSHIRHEVEACVKIQNMIIDHRFGIMSVASIQQQLQTLHKLSTGETVLLEYETLPSPLDEQSHGINNGIHHDDYSTLPLPPSDSMPISAKASPSVSSKRKRRNSAQQSQEVEISLLEKEVRTRLKHLYESISELIEDKLNLLRMVQDITDYYESSIGALGERSGVLHVREKIQFLINPHLKPLISHKVFCVQEEETMLAAVKKAWAALFLGNETHVQLADEDLNRRVLIKSKTSEEWIFYVKIGAGVVFLLWSLSECFNNEIAKSHIWNDPTFAIFMCFGDFLLLLFMWAVSMYVWRHSGIDYIKLLNLHDTEIPQSKHPVLMVMQSFATDILIFLVTFIFFNKAVRGAYHGHYKLAYAHTLPVMLAIYYFYRMCQPFETRKTWLYMLWKVLGAPWYSVEFRDGYIGDLLTSLVRVSVPFIFSLVYVIISLYAWLMNDMKWILSTSDRWWTDQRGYSLVLLPFLTIFPLWIRLLQCLRRSVETGNRWPHMANALKYTSAIFVISFGTFQPSVRTNYVWILCFTLATIFQFSWDIFQDWGILQIQWPSPNRNHHDHIATGSSASADGYNIWETFERLNEVTITMRTKRLLGPKWIYLAVMGVNLVLRFAWTLTLLPPQEPTDSWSFYATFMNHLIPFIAAAEIVRRMVWGFFRLEWEQIEVLQKANLIDYLDDDLEQMQGIEHGLSPVSAKESKFPQSADWFSYMPRAIVDIVEGLKCLDSWTSKVRLVESIIFASVVVYVVSIAAWPAFHPLKVTP